MSLSKIIELRKQLNHLWQKTEIFTILKLIKNNLSNFITINSYPYLTPQTIFYNKKENNFIFTKFYLSGQYSKNYPSEEFYRLAMELKIVCNDG